MPASPRTLPPFYFTGASIPKSAILVYTVTSFASLFTPYVGPEDRTGAPSAVSLLRETFSVPIHSG